jgi:hypothetical protein
MWWYLSVGSVFLVIGIILSIYFLRHQIKSNPTDDNLVSVITLLREMRDELKKLNKDK